MPEVTVMTAKQARAICTENDYVIAGNNGIDREGLERRITVGWEMERARTEPMIRRKKKPCPVASTKRAVPKNKRKFSQKLWQEFNENYMCL